MLPLTKQQFCSYIQSLAHHNQLAHSYDDLLQNEPDFYHPLDGLRFFCQGDETIIQLLQLLMQDTTEMISYFCYELDYGNLWEPGMVQDEQGQDIPLQTPEQLYDFLVDANDAEDVSLID